MRGARGLRLRKWKRSRNYLRLEKLNQYEEQAQKVSQQPGQIANNFLFVSSNIIFCLFAVKQIFNIAKINDNFLPKKLS
jgi:hypothetical protein